MRQLASQLRAYAYLVFPRLSLPSQDLVHVGSRRCVLHEARRPMRLLLRLEIVIVIVIVIVVVHVSGDSVGIRTWGRDAPD